MNVLELLEYKETNAKKRGIKMKLDAIDIANILGVLKCEYTGKALDRPTLERLDSSKGYVRGNVVRVNYSVNTIKDQSDTVEELESRIADLEHKLKAQKTTFYNAKSSDISISAGKKCIKTYHKILALKDCREYLLRKKTLKDKITTHFCLPRDMSISQVIKVVSNDFCIRAFCKGELWLQLSLQRIPGQKS